jgi:hypothetical protein
VIHDWLGIGRCWTTDMAHSSSLLNLGIPDLIVHFLFFGVDGTNSIHVYALCSMCTMARCRIELAWLVLLEHSSRAGKRVKPLSIES